jgi:hypothetical protein
MFTDALGEVNLLSDKRHVPAGRASVIGLRQKIFRCGKVTRRYCTVNAIPAWRVFVQVREIYSAVDFTCWRRRHAAKVFRAACTMREPGLNRSR